MPSLPPTVTPFLPIFTAPPIHLPKLRSPPSRPHVPFFKLPSHAIPVKWSLYRRLLQQVPDNLHRDALRKRWRRPRKQYCTSPRLAQRLLQKEEQLLADYRELIKLRRQPGRTQLHEDQVTTDRESSAIIPSHLELHSYHETKGLSLQSAARLQALQQTIESFNLSDSISSYVTDSYRTSLEQASYAFRPIRTPGLLFPSLLNPPLPRVKPQPLHMTMVMTHRQQARDRRILQFKSWQEMRVHLRNEQRFEQSIGLSRDDQSFEYIDATTSSLKQSETTDFKRIHLTFPQDTLQRRDAARRSRPSILTAQRRKKDTAARLERILRAARRDGSE